MDIYSGKNMMMMPSWV